MTCPAPGRGEHWTIRSLISPPRCCHHHDVELLDDDGCRLARARLPEGLEGIARLHALTAVGLVLTLADGLPVVVVGLAVMTAGFFCVHGIASGWVPVRADDGDVPPAQAASLYLFAYYAGSSVFGSLAGTAWSMGKWPAVVLLASVFVAVSGVLSAHLRQVPSASAKS